MRKRLASLAVILAAFGLVFGPAASALAFLPNGQWVCAASGSGRCIQHSSPQITDGTNVGSDDKIAWGGADNACNQGFVDPNTAGGGPCPFPNGSGWNNTFKNDRIVCLNFLNAGGYVAAGAYNDWNVWQQSCGDPGTFWVVDGNTDTFINVATSKVAFNIGHKTVQVLCTVNGDNRTDTQDWKSGNCTWGPG